MNSNHGVFEKKKVLDKFIKARHVSDTMCAAHPEAGLVVQAVVVEVVVEAAPLVIVGDQEHLGPAPRALDVSRDEAEDVVMPHEHGLVDLCLSEPAGLLCGEEHLDSDPLSPPPGQPDLSIPALANTANLGLVNSYNTGI